MLCNSKNVHFVGRDRVNGFSLAVSWDSMVNYITPPGHICYKDDISEVTNQVIYDLDCYVPGKYVIFYNKIYPEYPVAEVFMTLCYVAIYGK